VGELLEVVVEVAALDAGGLGEATGIGATGPAWPTTRTGGDAGKTDACQSAVPAGPRVRLLETRFSKTVNDESAQKTRRILSRTRASYLSPALAWA